MVDNSRRAFISLAGGAALAALIPARARSASVPVIGYLSSGSAEEFAPQVVAFRKGLREAGYAEGRNVAIEFRWADDAPDRLRQLAADLVRDRVTLIVAAGNLNAPLAAKAATATIPIVFASGGNPVAAGLVKSLSRPGGNVTGVTGIGGGLGTKQLGLLHELSPGAKRVAVLVDPTSPSAEKEFAQVDAAATSIGVQIEAVTAAAAGDIDPAFRNAVQKHASALLVLASALFISRRVELAMLAVKYAIPAIYAFRVNAEAGGLMSYGPNVADVNRQAGLYAGRILKGKKPADLPVIEASKFEFVINLQTARVMGIEIPATLLARADEVME